MFFIVLDLRLTKVGVQRNSFFYVLTRRGVFLLLPEKPYQLFHLEPIFLQTSGRKSRNVSIIFMFSFGETYVSAMRTVRFALRNRMFFVAET